MKWFYDLKIRAKLLIGFLTVALVAGLVGAIGTINIRKIAAADQDLYSGSTQPIGQLVEVASSLQRVRGSIRDVMLASTPARAQEYVARVREYSATMDKAAAEYGKSVDTPQEKDDFEAFQSAWAAYKPVGDQIVALAVAGRKAEALRLQDARARDLGNQVDAAIDKITTAIESEGKAISDHNSLGAGQAVLQMYLLMLIAVVISLGMGLFIARSIATPVANLVEVADALAAGNLDVKIEADTKDEVGELSAAFRRMAENLNRFLAQMKMMYEGQVAGDIDAYMPSDRFEGAYRDMAVEVNNAVKMHVDNILMILETLSAYAEGNFAPVLKKLPGKQVIANEKMDLLRGNLQKLVQETRMLVQAAASGDLSQRGDAQQFQGGYRDIVQGVNDTLEAIVAPLTEAEAVLARMALNDYTTGMDGQYAGDYQKLANGVNETLSRLHSMLDALERVARGDFSRLEELQRIGRRCENDRLMPALRGMMEAVVSITGNLEATSQAVAEGRLDARIDCAPYEGRYRDLANGVNAMVAAVEAPLTAAGAVLAKMAVNDYTAAMTGDYEGAYRQLGNDINAVRERLLAIQDIVQRVSVGDLSRYEEIRNIGKRSENDHIVPSLTAMMGSIQALIDEMKGLSDAAVAGNLSTRGDAQRFQGGYRDIIRGVNETLDAVMGPINEAAEILERVANKDMTSRVQGNYSGDHARIKEALNTAVENLDEGLSQVALGAEQVASASIQISTGAQTLSQGASEQASSLEEISSSLQEMASMTRQNAGNAQEARSLSDGAMRTAEQGVESMRRLSEAMERIKTSSDETAKIVKTIDEIAFQTNLLALNAAVEAARAGDAGKGFAVVAEEVRNLAMRSAEAAKSTSALIEGAVQNAQDGVGMNEEVLRNLREINDQTHKVSEVMAEIAAASEQQSQGIEQVNVAVQQMDQLTQQNAANSEESASAAEELSSQAEEMQGMVASFRLSQAQGSVRPVRERRRAERGGGAKAPGLSGTPGNGHGHGHVPAGVGNGHGADPRSVIPFDDDNDILQSF